MRGQRAAGAESARIEDRGHVTPCAIWQGTISSEGYALMGALYVHRRSYIEVHGSVPDGCEIDHLCRQRACVRDDHLEAVPRKINARRGAKAKLTFEQVEQIRQHLAEGKLSQGEIARRFGVTAPRICQINTGKAWA